VLLETLTHLPEDTKTGGFVDYGSGKGRALFCAEYSGFNQLIGVELDESLIQIAKANLKSYSKKRPESHFTFVHQNAADFEIPDGCRVFYFFNPFGESVMTKVIEKIKSYRAKHSQTIYIVYVNPKFDSLWRSRGFKVFHTQKTARYTEAIAYYL
jgi:predicted RNA methylase